MKKRVQLSSIRVLHVSETDRLKIIIPIAVVRISCVTRLVYIVYTLLRCSRKDGIRTKGIVEIIYFTYTFRERRTYNIHSRET